jgi:subtilisin family serine protease
MLKRITANAAMLGFVLLFLIVGPANAQPGPEGMTEAGKKEFVQGHFDAMYKRAASRASEILESGRDVKAFAVVVTLDQKVRLVQLAPEQLSQMPAPTALEIMRRSLRTAVEEKGTIGGVTVVYTADNPNQNAKASKVLVLEMEHVFGAHLAQLVPYTMEGGNAMFGQAVVASIEPTILKINREEGSTDPSAGSADQ